MGCKYGVPNIFLILLYHMDIILTNKCNESCRPDFLRGCDNNDASVPRDLMSRPRGVFCPRHFPALIPYNYKVST